MLPESFTPELLQRLELFRLHTRRAYLGNRQGGHLSLKRGHGIEFSDYRKYEPGDSPRHIDWGVYGRTERLYVKRFQEEQSVTALIFVDTSNSMGTPAEEKKWERSIEIALAIAYVTLMSQDQVIVAAPGNFVTPVMGGPRAIHTIADNLMKASPREDIDLKAGLYYALSKVRFPGLAIFISDLMMPFEECEGLFNMLRAKNLDITSVQMLSPTDIDPFPDTNKVIAVDSESGEEVPLRLDEDVRQEYGVLLASHNEQLRQYFNSCNISNEVAFSTQNIDQIITEVLPKTGLLIQ